MQAAKAAGEEPPMTDHPRRSPPGLQGQMSDSLLTAAFIVLSGGFQDAYTYCVRGGVFANAQTGNIVLLSAHLFHGEWAASLRYVIPLLSFLLGVITAESIRFHGKTAKTLHWRQVILLTEAVLLLTVGFMPERWNLAANALVSYVCAMQVQAFHTVRGHAYASTMCIGNMRSGAEALYAYFRCRDPRVRQKAGVYFTVILLFALGAGAGCLTAGRLGVRAVWVCCPLLLISFLLMFLRERKPRFSGDPCTGDSPKKS